MRTASLALLLAASSGCQVMQAADAASCAEGDYGCMLASFDPEDVKQAVLYIGPCYRFAYSLCEKLYDCDQPYPSNCVETMVETMCMVPFDAEAMDDCAYLMSYAECSLLESPTAAQSESVCLSAWR